MLVRTVLAQMPIRTKFGCVSGSSPRGPCSCSTEEVEEAGGTIAAMARRQRGAVAARVTKVSVMPLRDAAWCRAVIFGDVCKEYQKLVVRRNQQLQLGARVSICGNVMHGPLCRLWPSSRLPAEDYCFDLHDQECCVLEGGRCAIST